MIETRKRARIIFSLLAAVVISSGFLLAFLSYGGATDVLATLTLAGSGAWFACLVCCLGCAFVRYLRLKTAVRIGDSATLLRISAWHGAAIAVFPARLGELVLPLLTKRAGLSSFVSGLGVLVLLRALDFGAIIFIGLIGYLAIGGFVGFEWLLVIALVIALCATPEIFAALGRYLRTTPSEEGASSRQGLSRLFVQFCGALASMGRPEAYKLVSQTILLWTMLLCASAVAFGGAAKVISLGAATLGLAGGSLAFALPVNGIASAGPFEAAYAFAAGLIGAAQAHAISAAIILHVCAVASALCFVLIAEVVVRLFARHAKRAAGSQLQNAERGRGFA